MNIGDDAADSDAELNVLKEKVQDLRECLLLSQNYICRSECRHTNIPGSATLAMWHCTACERITEALGKKK